MKKNTFLIFFLVVVVQGFAQQTVLELFEYTPAPGQHINLENTGTPAAAQKMTENVSSLISLGSFGGYVVLGFDRACVNHPDHPYGIDFTIFGNAFSGSSEPGVVWVMQDKNQNGQPDDTWFQIAGSAHFYSRTVMNYEVTYYQTDTRDVLWKDQFGETGWLKGNNYNVQEYYPTAAYFPDYPRDSVTFGGTRLAPLIDFSNGQEIQVMSQAFGYADNRPRKQGIDLSVPDNPYTKEVEGAGGDPIDISWAVDRSGNYVKLDSIHFVKIVSGSLASAGRLGEISTDIAWVEAVKPEPGITGDEQSFVVYPYPFRVLAGDSFHLEACFFRKGQIEDAEISYTSRNEYVAGVNSAGWVHARNAGETAIILAAGDALDTVDVKVVVPDSISCLADLSGLYPGDSVELITQVYDRDLFPLDVPVQVSSSDPSVGKSVIRGDSCFFAAYASGEIILTFSAEGFALERQMLIRVLSANDLVRVYFSLQTEMENVLPFQWIDVGPADLNHVVQDRKSDYSGLERPMLFHAVTAGLKKAGVPFLFRDDESAGGKLYLYLVENDGLFYYGWGGKNSSTAFSRAWIARLNDQSYMNNFDQINLSDGDTLALYHVSDFSGSWNYSRLLASVDSASTGDEIEVWLEETTCTFSEEAGITESGFVPVAGVTVEAGESYDTNEQGHVAFILQNDPPLVVTSGGTAVLISARMATGVYPVVRKSSLVYPNPFDKVLNIRGYPPDNQGSSRIDESTPQVIRGTLSAGDRFHGTVMRIFTPGGRLVFEQMLFADFSKIDLSFLPAGMYHLVIFHQNRMETHKIIRK